VAGDDGVRVPQEAALPGHGQQLAPQHLGGAVSVKSACMEVKFVESDRYFTYGSEYTTAEERLHSKFAGGTLGVFMGVDALIRQVEIEGGMKRWCRTATSTSCGGRELLRNTVIHVIHTRWSASSSMFHNYLQRNTDPTVCRCHCPASVAAAPPPLPQQSSMVKSSVAQHGLVYCLFNNDTHNSYVLEV
jgi:hypothetical protein